MSLTVHQLREVVRHSIVCFYQGVFKTWDDQDNLSFTFEGTFSEFSQMHKDLSTWYKQKGITWNMINSISSLSNPEKVYVHALTHKGSKVAQLLSKEQKEECLYDLESIFSVLDKYITEDYIQYCLSSKSIALNKFAALRSENAVAVLLLDKKKTLRNFAKEQV